MLPAEPPFAAPILDRDIDRLLQGRLHDPHRLLGSHPFGPGNVRVRVLQPDARSMSLVEPAAELTRMPGTALFEWTGPKELLALPYRLRIETHYSSAAMVERTVAVYRALLPAAARDAAVAR